MRPGGVIIGLAAIGIFALWLKNFASDLKMPTTHDRLLVGRWVAKKGDGSTPRFKEIQFRSNGTAIVPGMSHITWGTDKGKLHIVGRASGTDWMNGVYRYSVDSKKHRLEFEKPLLDLLPRVLTNR